MRLPCVAMQYVTATATRQQHDVVPALVWDRHLLCEPALQCRRIRPGLKSRPTFRTGRAYLAVDTCTTLTGPSSPDGSSGEFAL